MRNINRNMLHMKLNSAVSIFAVAAAFAVLLPPSNASAGVCFLPDCEGEDGNVFPELPPDPNIDTEKCEKEGYTYYSSGECPKYYAETSECRYDSRYLKCDAVTWCKNNGYNTQTCSLPSFVNDQCPNGQPYYNGCKEDKPRACRESGYVNSCSPGRLYATTKRCPWDKTYGTCCTAAASAGCPTNYKINCTGAASGTDTCGYTCYRCCDDTCPSGTSKNYSGSISTYTECGTACKKCKGCPSGSSTSYSGTFVTSSECGACYKCSNSCSSGSTNPSCSSGYEEEYAGSTECGSSCYKCVKHTHYYTCPSGYSTSNSCSYGSTTSSKRCSCGATSGTCYKCKSKPAEPAHDPDECKSYYWEKGSSTPWCGKIINEPQDQKVYPWCSYKQYCTTYGGSKKLVRSTYNEIVGGRGYATNAECDSGRPTSCPSK